MKKRLRRIFVYLAALVTLASLCLLFSSCNKEQKTNLPSSCMEEEVSPSPMMHLINPDSEVRGVWIASVFNINYPSRTDLSADELKAEIDAILDTCEENGLNTVFFQVRPSCDALYDSDIFPVSSVLSTNGELTFDVLEYLVDAAHHRNIFVHAWVNPLRVTTLKDSEDTLSSDSPAVLHPEYTVKYADGKTYLNAGMPEVRQLVADGVEEIVSKYDVDGVVFDDYFYPYPSYADDGQVIDFDDAAEYEKYGTDFDDIGDWRRDNINTLIELCYYTIKSVDPDCDFGVAPTGIWQNDEGENGGSATNGFEAFDSLYCDALAWIEGGYIDYISPQIYWDFDTSETPYDTILRWWNTQLDGSDVKLYVSHSAYRYGDGSWSDPSGELTEQITYARSEKYYRGSMLYGYAVIADNTADAADEISELYSDEVIYTDIVSNGLGVTISSPSDGSEMDAAQTYIIGSSDPYYALTVNGEKVGRTRNGYFSLYVTLSPGENVFTFTQNGIDYVYTLYYGMDTLEAEDGESTEEEPAEEETEPEEVFTISETVDILSKYPTARLATDAETIWVSCIAPAGAEVSADIGGTVTALVPLESPSKEKTDEGYVCITYGANAALPTADKGEVLECGSIILTVKHPDGECTSEGSEVRILGEGAYITVQTKSDYSSLKVSTTSSYYEDYTTQSEGMTDCAVSLKNGWYTLRMGGVIAEDEVIETGISSSDSLYEISGARMENNGTTTDLIFTCDGSPAYNGTFDDSGRFVFTFYSVNPEDAADLEICSNPLISSCETVKSSDKVRYSLELYDTKNFYGFDLEYTEDGMVISLRNPVVIDLESSKPLRGISIILDAGHGGWDSGAAGAKSGYAEKDLNFSIVWEAAFMLADLGADVDLTRTDDTYVSLDDRRSYLAEKMPDLCVSVHQNSMGYSTDITQVRGTLALWCMDAGTLLSDCVGRSIADALGHNYQGCRYQSLAMCRNPKFPAALIETSFMTSVEEYDLMVEGDGVLLAAQGLVDGILDYFAAQAKFAVN